jgi:TatD DNase family protein
VIDIGANLTHSSFTEDLGEVVSRARKAGVTSIVITGTTAGESREAAAIAERFDLYSTAGIHPHHAKDFKNTDELKSIAAHPRVVAIGECGLDFNRNYSPHPAQEECFTAQIELGLSLKKPLFLHSRDAHPRFSQIISSFKPQKAVAHCFTGERAELRAYLDLGLYIGITGWICDERRGKHLLELVREIPRDRLLLETDSPYLTPRDMKPQPRARRNEPAFLTHILATVARALGRSAEEVAADTTHNARTLFGLHEPGPSPAAKRPLAA